MHRHWITVSALALTCGGLIQVAHAQARAVKDADANAPSSTDQLDEIIVTAQKRSERLIDVPLSISAVSGDQIKRQGIDRVEQLERVVPGLTYQKSTYGAPILTIRGVGFYDTSSGGSPAVSVYVDQVPVPYSVMAAGVAVDLERVEVLKGPQGTLFGVNSTGGAINFIAAKPTDETAAGFDLDYGRFNSLNAQAFVSGTLAPGLRARVFGRYEYRDPWQRGFAPNDSQFGKSPGQTLGRRKFGTGRFVLDWDATSALSFELNVNAWRDTSDSQAAQFVTFAPGSPQNPGNAPVYTAFSGLQSLPNDARVAGWDAGKNYAKRVTFEQYSLRSNYDLGSAKIVSITAFSRYDARGLIDVDGAAYPLFAVDPVVKQRVFSQELRIEGSSGDLKWIAGGNYQHDLADETQKFTVGTTNSYIGPFHFTQLNSLNFQRVDTYAGFGGLDFALSSTVSVAGSVRYTKQDRSFRGCAADPGDGVFGGVIGIVFTGAPVAPGNCTTLAAPPGPTTIPMVLPIVEDTLNEDNVSWRGTVTWKPEPNTTIYATAAKGYKAGAYANVPANFALQTEPARQESVQSYEVGMKLQRWNRRLELTLAGFYYDYDDKQLTGGVNVAPFGYLPKLINVPKSYATGVEAGLTVRPLAGLTISGGATYVYSKVTRDPAAGALDPFGNLVSFVGEAFPNTPRFQGTVGMQYDIPVSDSLNLVLGNTLSYKSSSQAAFGNVPAFRMPGYALLDLRAGLESPEGKWRLQIWGQNVTNKFYVNNIDRRADAITRTTSMPATYGIMVAYRY